MIKKIKELGHTASLMQKIVIIVALAYFNFLCFALIDANMVKDASIVPVQIATWFLVVIPFSLYICFLLFPKKD